MTQPTTYPVFAQGLPDPFDGPGKYKLRFASTLAELEAVQRLRFEVFNLELGEGLEESYATGLDQDRFDPVSHHLMIADDELDGITRALFFAR
ncbi:MAG: GNAT family N-acetyltransferase [Acidobacteria bacterium]|nr:GNAT family N-acetyltransferase [Acidobacteriota bacterium]